MRIAAGHRDRVRVEVETNPVTRLGTGSVVVDVNRDGIIDDRLQTLAADQSRCRTDAEITTICGVGVPGKQAARLEAICKDQVWYGARCGRRQSKGWRQ